MRLDDFNPSQQSVLVMGAAGLDIVGRPSQMPEFGASVPAEVRPSFGGVARNIAENLARLGQPVSLITVVGKDTFGPQLLEYTARAGVDTSACLQSSRLTTAAYLAVLTEQSRLHFALDDMRVLTELTSAYLRKQEHRFASAGLIFVDANLSPAALRTVFSLARKYRVPVCADATSSVLAVKLKPYLSQLFMITANPYEAAILSGAPAAPEGPEAAQKVARDLIALGAEIAVLPIAAFGVCYASSETSGHIPAIRTAILDPTGAGDALTASVIFGLLNHISLDEATRLGVSAASLTLRHPGTVYPDLSLEILYDQLVI